MATFMFYCSVDGQRLPVEAPVGDAPAAPWCILHHQPLKRDYRGEAIGVGQGVRVSRASGIEGGGQNDWRDFLPSTDDFKGPSDPDGTKGLRKWRDEHKPANAKARHPEEHLLRRSW